MRVLPRFVLPLAVVYLNQAKSAFSFSHLNLANDIKHVASRTQGFSKKVIIGKNVIHPSNRKTIRFMSSTYKPEKDFLVTDSVELPDELRPSVLSSISNPRDLLAIVLLIFGLALSVLNVFGQYGNTYMLISKLSIYLGISSSLASFLQVYLGYNVNRGTSSIRRGIVDDPTVTLYAGSYSATITWEALRTSSFCPDWLIRCDVFLPWIAVFVYGFSLIAPLVTLLGPNQSAWLTKWRDTRPQTERSETPELSETELLRCRGILAIGFLACVFLPDALAFGLKGQQWWGAVTASYPSQTTLESSTALFALYATEASMISHRCGKIGVAKYSNIVPSFAVVCLILAIIPCITSLYWLGGDVSFFSFYTE